MTGFRHLSINSNAGIKGPGRSFSCWLRLQNDDRAAADQSGRERQFLVDPGQESFFVTHWMDCLKDDPTVKSQA